ncbi:MAG: hypothetical protein P0119_07890 [Nitrospira sp.]|nr:hypothetical protein [Nitrospira sp.]
MAKPILSLCRSGSTPVGGLAGFRLFVRATVKEVLAGGTSGGYRLARERQEQYEGESILPID